MNNHRYILTLNSGSSSIKISLYENTKEGLLLQLSGKAEQIGTANVILIIKQGNTEKKVDLHASDFDTVIKNLTGWLGKQEWFGKVHAIGHRIVFGMKHTKAVIITGKLLNELTTLIEYDPDHLPAQISIIKILKAQYPQLPQIVCFDTAFHHTIPDVAKTFAIPKKYDKEGIRRYGFHGISYSYLLQELKRMNAKQAKGRIIMAHLGNGASLAAIKDGRCIDTSMGFTPAGGIVMSTRSGDIDPGIARFLLQKQPDTKAFNDIINHKSGLLGISGLSSDMQVLLLHEQNNGHAALAINIFCYQIKKYIGAYTAALGGLDTLVFAGGIGENAPQIRIRICQGLQYAGVVIDKKKNAANEKEISSSESKVKVFVIPTNEELMIAETTWHLYSKHLPK
ncbi:MAG: acetate/propionate family kinase [Arachidicoccus sp.]|nr:acetate/propionate family kinase [Arachidicoccus sp.]